jgi:hypothetical protein
MTHFLAKQMFDVLVTYVPETLTLVCQTFGITDA